MRETLNRCPTTLKVNEKNQLRLERVKYLLVKHQNLKIYLVSSSVLNSINGNITVVDNSEEVYPSSISNLTQTIVPVWIVGDIQPLKCIILLVLFPTA